MFKYYERIPSAAIIQEFDGNLYGNSSCELYRLSNTTWHVRQSRESKLRRVAFVRGGEAYLYLGCAGRMVACVVNLPVNVSVEEE